MYTEKENYNTFDKYRNSHFAYSENDYDVVIIKIYNLRLDLSCELFNNIITIIKFFLYIFIYSCNL